MEQTLYGTNLDGELVVRVINPTLLKGVIQLHSDLLEETEQFFKVRAVEEGKTLHNGRVPKEEWEKNRLELMPLKGIQSLQVAKEDTEGFVYNIEGVTGVESASFESPVPVKKNQPLVFQGTLYQIDEVEKTSKKTGILHLSDYPLSTSVKHLYLDKRWSKRQGRFVVVGFAETHRDYWLRKIHHPEKEPA